MKIQKIILLSSLLIAGAAQANVSIRLPASPNGDTCATLAGVWAGGGKVKAGIIDCHYHGTANVSSISPSGMFNMNVVLHKDIGICPDDEQIDLPGSCQNGVLELKTDKANLHGKLSDSGKSVDLNGKVTFDVFGSPVVADVSDMHMEKQ